MPLTQMKEEENWRGREAEGSGTLQGMYFKRFPMLLPPHNVGFVSLLVANANCGVCVFTPSERGESLENF